MEYCDKCGYIKPQCQCEEESEYEGCDNCKYVYKSKSELPCMECTRNRAIDYYKPMTNADRIRNMTDDELASFLIAMQVSAKVRNRVDSKKEIDEYLQAEVKEGNSNENT